MTRASGGASRSAVRRASRAPQLPTTSSRARRASWRRATRRSTTRTSATTATSTARKDLSNDKCLGCHDHKDLDARINAGKGFHASALVKGKNCEICHLEHKGRGYDIMGWRSVAGRREGLRPRAHRLAAQRQARADRLRRVPQGAQQAGPARSTWAPTSCAARRAATTTISRTSSSARTCSRASAATARACGSRRSASSQKFNHDDRKDAGDAAVRQRTRTSRARSATPRRVFNLPFAEARRVRQQRLPHRARTTATCSASATASGATRRRSRRSSSRTSITPSGRKLRPRPRAQARSSATTATPRRSARTSRPARASSCHAKDNQHGDRFDAVRRPAEVRRCATRQADRSSRRTRSTTARSTNFTLTGKHADVACRTCHRGKSPSDFERFTTSSSRRQGRRAWAATSTRTCTTRSTRTTSARTSRCLGCHSDAGKLEFDYKNADRALPRPEVGLPARQGAQGRAVRATATPAASNKGKTTFDKIPADCNASGKCHEDSLHKGTLGEECERVPQLGHVGRAQVRSQRAVPRRRQGRGEELPAQGRAQEERVRGLPRREPQVRRDAGDVLGRGLPRRRRRAQGPARRQVRAVPRRDRRQHLQPQHDERVPRSTASTSTCAAPTAIRR